MSSVRPLSVADAAYLAGLIDGEGTVALSRRHAGERRQLVLSISSTERDLLDWTRQATGVGKITRKRSISTKHAPAFTYAVANRQALAILEQVSPYLRSYKALRARLVLDHYLAVTPRNGKYSPCLALRRCEFEDVFAALTHRH
jgi:hypothetical protein